MLKRQSIFAIVGFIAVFILLHLGLSSAKYPPRPLGATMLGGVAFLLMTVGIVLSTRASPLENLFGGLDRMYQVHRVVGVSVALVALVHLFVVPKELPPGTDPTGNSLVPSVPLGILGLVLLVIGLFVRPEQKNQLFQLATGSQVDGRCLHADRRPLHGRTSGFF